MNATIETLPDIPGFETLGLIGEGGMGEVVLARSNTNQETVAIKLMKTASMSVEDRQRFAREARLAAQLEHPNLVTIFDHGSTEDRDFYVMEYVDGQSLRQALESRIPDVGFAAKVIDGVSKALQHMHNDGILHRDIKPDNILLSNDGSVKVADFGVSVSMEEIGLMTATGHAYGTWDYMAPEQRTRLPVDERADQYSLAVVAYELLTQKRPYGRFKKPSELNRLVDGAVDAALSKALQQEADDRFASVAKFNQAFQSAVSRGQIRAKLRFATVAAWIATPVAVLLAVIGLAAIDRPERIAFAQATANVTSDTVSDVQPETAAESIDQPDDVGHAGRRHPEPPPPREPPPPKRLTRFEEWLMIEPHEVGGQPPKQSDFEKWLIQSGAGDETLEKVEHLRTRANGFVSQKRYELAVVAYNEAVRLSPSDAGLLVERAALFERMYVYDRAIAELTAALEIDSELEDARTNLGFLHLLQKDYASALNVLDEQIRRHPTDGRAHAFRGQARIKIEDVDGGLADLTRSIELDPKCHYGFHYRALLLGKRRDYPAALADYEASIKADPENPFPHAFLAEYLVRCSDRSLRSPKKALAAAKVACELCDNSEWQCLYSLGLAQMANRNLDAAIVATEQSLEIAPPQNEAKVQELLNALRFNRNK